MLDDQLTLLDGTDVLTIGAAADIAGLDLRYARDLALHAEGLQPETVLDGVSYFSRDALLAVLVDAR